MDLPAFIETPLRLALLIAGVIVPGSMVLRALRLPWSLAAAFVTSIATLYVVVLIFACTGATISLMTLTAALGGVALIGRLLPTRTTATAQPSSFSSYYQMGGWLPLYLVFWAIVGYRLIYQPLSGPDVYFRWSYLAEQMLRFGSLDFYPPRSGADFVHYFWAESIPPGIASLYTWAYACGGSKLALWTSPIVALQLLSTHEIIWRIAHRWGGEEVARRAVLLAAACPLLTWSFIIGQETGLTALSVTGLVWCLQNTGQRNRLGWIALAGIFSIAAASTREYGPIFAVAAIIATVFMRLPRKQTLLLALVALPFALAWPVRVWLLTGNPFFSLEVGGLFPTNPVCIAWSKIFHQAAGDTFSSLADWKALGRYLLLWALPATIGLVALLFLLVRQLREARVVAFFVAIVIGLWVASVPHTAGGLFYSLRVLSPAFALLVVAGSYALGFLNRYRTASGLVSFAIFLLYVEALPKTLVLPENPYRVTARDWPQAGGQFNSSVRTSEQVLLATITKLPEPGRHRILSDIAGLPRLLAPVGMEAVPLWSTEVAWLFDATVKPQELARLWQESGLGYVAIGKASPTGDFVRTHAQWRAPYFTVIPIIETDGLLILQVTVKLAPAR